MNLRTTLLAATTLVLMLVGPASAYASASIHRTGNFITITSNAASDHILADDSFASRTRVRFRNTAGALFAGHGCTRVARTTFVDCGPYQLSGNNPLKLTVNLGAGNDTFSGHRENDREPRVIVHGGAGDDFITGTTLSDDLFGDSGHDTLYGLDDTDNLQGGDGPDTVFGGNGNDVLSGGAGVDSLYGDEFSDNPDWGSDEIDAFDTEADQIQCGRGQDAAVVDATEVFNAFGDSSCEALSGGQTTPPLEHPEGTLPMTVVIGAPDTTSIARLALGAPLHYPITFSAPGSIAATLNLAPSSASIAGLGHRTVDLADGMGTPFTFIPLTLNAQVRVAWQYRPALVARSHARGFRGLPAYIEIKATSADGATTTVRRNVMLTR